MSVTERMLTHQKKKVTRKYKVIAKVPAPETKEGYKFVKYRTNNRENFISFLMTKFSGAYWANFYEAKGENFEKLTASWGCKKGLVINTH